MRFQADYDLNNDPINLTTGTPIRDSNMMDHLMKDTIQNY
jgi:hypothetical protein